MKRLAIISTAVALLAIGFIAGTLYWQRRALPIEAIFTIIGTILGFVLSELATRLREKRTEEKQIRAVRTMLSLEIDHNLALLRDSWSKANQVDESEQDPNRARLRLARRMIQLPLPHWSHMMWESQMSLLPKALTEEQIKQAHDFHNRLDTISAIRSRLSALESEQREEWRAAQDETGMVTSLSAVRFPFDANAPSLWMQCERIVDDLLDKGNPLQGQKRNGGQQIEIPLEPVGPVEVTPQSL